MNEEELLQRAALDEDAARRVAEIIGPLSAAGRAIAEVEASRVAGVPAYVFRNGRSWVVARANAPEARPVEEKEGESRE